MHAIAYYHKICKTMHSLGFLVGSRTARSTCFEQRWPHFWFQVSFARNRLCASAQIRLKNWYFRQILTFTHAYHALIYAMPFRIRIEMNWRFDQILSLLMWSNLTQNSPLAIGWWNMLLAQLQIEGKGNQVNGRTYQSPSSRHKNLSVCTGKRAIYSRGRFHSITSPFQLGGALPKICAFDLNGMVDLLNLKTLSI